MVEVLTDLEADKFTRGRIILILRELEGAE
jgi:hypothetical protein